VVALSGPHTPTNGIGGVEDIRREVLTPKRSRPREIPRPSPTITPTTTAVNNHNPATS